MTLAISRAAAACVLLSAVVTAGCGSSSPTPTPTSPSTPTSPTTPTAPATSWSAAGRITAFGTNQAVGGATITPAWSLGAVTADADGNFTVGDVANPPTSPYAVNISGNGMVPRDTWFAWSHSARTGVDVSLIRNAAPFSMDFYRQFVRDTYDNSDGSPWPVLRWTSAPSFYVRTVDSTGRAVEPEVLAVTLDAIRRAVPAYTGGTYSAATIETGTDVRAAATGWINVDFVRNAGGRTCGTSFVGRNPGVITLYVDVCACGSVKVPGAVTMHEVGHAMGFFHVSDTRSLMYPFASGACPAGVLSAAESYHAALAYSRPRGNRDPDRDPSTGASLSTAMVGGGPLVK